MLTEAMTAEHEHFITLVHQGGNRHRPHVDDVVLEPPSTRRLDVDKGQAHPLIIVNCALAPSDCAVLIRAGRFGHSSTW